MFIPSIPSGLFSEILRAIISEPWLLNPNLLIKAWSFSSLKILGLGLPNCLLGVIVPTSTKPNPNLKSELYTSALLSKPAANPIGFSSFLLNRFVSSSDSSFTLKKTLGQKICF